LDINPRYIHSNQVAQTEYPPGTLAGQRVLYGIEVVVVRRQGGDVHQSLDVDASQLDEQAEAGHRGDQAIETLADLVLHELALEPAPHDEPGLTRPALGLRTIP